MKIKRSKKALSMTTLEYILFVIGFIVLMVVAAYLLGTLTAWVEREIKGQTGDIKSEETLVFYLSSCLSKDPAIKGLLDKDSYKVAEELADSKTTFSDLIVMIGKNDSEAYKLILQKETEYLLNATLGNDNWRLDIKYPDGKELSCGDVKGENTVYELRLPSAGYQLTNIKLTVKKL